MGWCSWGSWGFVFGGAPGLRCDVPLQPLRVTGLCTLAGRIGVCASSVPCL